MYLSYSGWKLDGACPRAYWHSYIDKTVLSVPDNKVNSLYGSTVGTLFEWFYTEKGWLREDPAEWLLGRVEEAFTAVAAKEIEKRGPNAIRWDEPKLTYKSKEALLKDVQDTIPRGVEAIRENGLVGPRVGAEVVLDSNFGPHIIGGRADFLIRRQNERDLCLVDGKGSRWREKYTEEVQLKWYAMLWHRKTRTLPDKLGFLYWRSEPDNAVDWIPFDETELHDLRRDVLHRMGEIEGAALRVGVARRTRTEEEFQRVLMAEFQPHPGDQCKRCAYREVCPVGHTMIKTFRKEALPGVNVYISPTDE